MLSIFPCEIDGRHLGFIKARYELGKAAFFAYMLFPFYLKKNCLIVPFLSFYQVPGSP